MDNTSKNVADFPYLNMDLKDLPTEEWKDITNYEGYYQISSYGRVKRLARESYSGWGTLHLLDERIKKSNLTIGYNKLLKEQLYTLVVTLYKDGTSRSFSVGRLLYYEFIAHFDLNNRKICICHKDRNGKNLHVSNLYLATVKDLRIKTVKDKRAEFKGLRKPVTQYNLSGDIIRHYNSGFEAAKIIDADQGGIRLAVNGTIHLYKGYYWRYGKNKEPLDVRKISKVNAKEQPKNKINKSMVEKLGIKNIQVDDVPAFLNLSLKTMKGEKWEDIPGHNGFYQVSNMGRIKVVASISEGKCQRIRAEQMISLMPRMHRRKDGTYSCATITVSLAKDRTTKKNYTVAHLVYHVFVAPILNSNIPTRIFFKDGDKTNLCYKNLQLKE